MSWKDYFFFQKNDRIAITLLLALIVLSGIVYVVTLPPSTQLFSDEMNDEIRGFEAQLENRDTVSYSDEHIYKEQSYKRTKYLYPTKLAEGETVELNAADTILLKKIPGIGSGYSNRIVKYRSLLGGYIDISQLKEVWGMDDDLYAKIIPYLTINPGANKLCINTASFEELNKHPYINYKQAEVIIDIRERKGNIESINRLSLLDEFSMQDIKRLRPYLSFE